MLLLFADQETRIGRIGRDQIAVYIASGLKLVIGSSVDLVVLVSH